MYYFLILILFEILMKGFAGWPLAGMLSIMTACLCCFYYLNRLKKPALRIMLIVLLVALILNDLLGRILLFESDDIASLFFAIAIGMVFLFIAYALGKFISKYDKYSIYHYAVIIFSVVSMFKGLASLLVLAVEQMEHHGIEFADAYLFMAGDLVIIPAAIFLCLSYVLAVKLNHFENLLFIMMPAAYALLSLIVGKSFIYAYTWKHEHLPIIALVQVIVIAITVKIRQFASSKSSAPPCA